MLSQEQAAELLESWLLNLTAERKSRNTVTSYREGVRQYLQFCAENGHAPDLSKTSVSAFTADLLENGAEASTARLRQFAVRRFSAWLAAEGEIASDELTNVAMPKLDQKLVPELTADDLGALLAACRGKRMCDKRDEAVVRLMAETGARAGEVINQNVPDVDVTRGLATIRKGKGGKARMVPFGPRTGSAIDRYLRHRKRQSNADSPRLWIGENGRDFTYAALYKALGRRAAAAGIAEFHPHMLRHTFAGRWLDSGGTEGGLMAVAGWSRREMIDRYSRATSERRAAEEARKLGLGDL